MVKAKFYVWDSDNGRVLYEEELEFPDRVSAVDAWEAWAEDIIKRAEKEGWTCDYNGTNYVCTKLVRDDEGHEFVATNVIDMEIEDEEY